MDADRHEAQPARRRGKRIMALFYRMAATWWCERLQVHRATLPDGTPVVVKVLRSGVDTLIRADLEGFRQVTRALLRWTRWAKTFDLAGVYHESLHILLREGPSKVHRTMQSTRPSAAMAGPCKGVGVLLQ